MPGFTVKIDGLSELNARLEKLKGDEQRRLSRRALRAGAKVFQREVEERAPERPNLPSGTALPPGALKRDVIIAGTRFAGTDSAVQVRPGARTNHAAHLVEYGHGLVVHGAHKGQVPAHPYARPAFEAGSAPALSAVAEQLRADLKRVDARAEVPDGE